MLQKEHGSCVAISAAMVGFFVLTVSASAFGLSDEDYDYLKMQHIERSEAPMLDLSPKERQRVHDLINDPETAGRSDRSEQERQRRARHISRTPIVGKGAPW